MSEFITVKEKIERRTYFTGRLTGKFEGSLDLKNSDLKTENFYDLEFVETKIFARKSDFRPWQVGNEPEEKSLTRLPNSVPCEILYEDGNTKNFKLQIHEAKLRNICLFNRLSEQNKLFITLEAGISGYLKHFDEIEKQIEIVSEPKKTIPKVEFNDSLNLAERAAQSPARHQSGVNNYAASGTAAHKGAPRKYWKGEPVKLESLLNGCAALFGLIFAGYLALAVVILFFSAWLQLFVSAGLILSALSPLLFQLSTIFLTLLIFVWLQRKMPRVWKWIFRIITATLFLFIWFS